MTPIERLAWLMDCANRRRLGYMDAGWNRLDEKRRAELMTYAQVASDHYGWRTTQAMVVAGVALVLLGCVLLVALGGCA